MPRWPLQQPLSRIFDRMRAGAILKLPKRILDINWPSKGQCCTMERSRKCLKYLVAGLAACIVCQVVLLAISLPGQRVQGDEAAFAEFAYWQANVGYLRSELFRGLLHYEDQILLYHKLFQWLGAAQVKIFGFHLWPLRALSLAAMAVLIVLLWRYFGYESRTLTKDRERSRLEFLIATAFLLLAPLTFTFAKFYRPEMIQAAFGLGSFIALRKGIDRPGLGWKLTAGALAGAAMLTHLNGVVFVLSGAGLLMIRRRWIALLWYSLAAAAVLTLFFVDIVGKFDLFWHQYADDPTFGEGERTIQGTLGKLLDEHKRLFRKPEIIFTSIVFFAAYFTNLAYQRRRLNTLHIYTALLIIALGALAPAKTTPYAILLFPFFAIEIAELGGGLIDGELSVPRWVRAALAAATVVFVLHSVGAAVVNAFTDKQDWVKDNRRVAERLPPRTHVLAPLDFVLNEIENFRISGLRVPHWRLCEWSKTPYTFDRLARYADSIGAEAVILDRDERRWLQSYPTTLGEMAGPYQLVEKFGDGGLWLWLRRSPRTVQ